MLVRRNKWSHAYDEIYESIPVQVNNSSLSLPRRTLYLPVYAHDFILPWLGYIIVFIGSVQVICIDYDYFICIVSVSLKYP